MEVHRYRREHCIMWISGSSAALENSRSPLSPSEAIWRSSQKDSHARYPYEEILSGCEEDVSSIRDGFTAWMKSDRETILMRHIVDVTRAYAAFREALARRHSPSCQGYHFGKDIPNRSTEQTRLSICNWNPGPRRGKEGALERHIAGNDTSLPYKKLLSTSSTIS